MSDVQSSRTVGLVRVMRRFSVVGKNKAYHRGTLPEILHRFRACICVEIQACQRTVIWMDIGQAHKRRVVTRKLAHICANNALMCD